MIAALLEIYLTRHGETAWRISGQHTGRTDIPLLAQGEAVSPWRRSVPVLTA